jgi:cell shape-determining protein MreC
MQKVDVVKAMNNCTYVLDNMDSAKDIAFKDTIKTLRDRVDEYETILNMLDGLEEENKR